jgi:hypothetical protein
MSTATADDDLVLAPTHELPESRGRRIGSGTFLIVLGVLVAVFLGLTLDSGATAHLRLGATTPHTCRRSCCRASSPTC